MYDDIKSHDKCGAQALLEGFIAYGWTEREILASKSPLFDELKQYVDLEDIFNDKGTEETSPNPSGFTPIYACGISPQCSFDYTPTPRTIDFEIGIPVTSLADLPLTPGEDLLYTPDCHLPNPEITTEIAEMSDTELESLMSVGTRPFIQTDGMVDSQKSIDSLIWDGIFDELNS